MQLFSGTRLLKRHQVEGYKHLLVFTSSYIEVYIEVKEINFGVKLAPTHSLLF